MPTFLSIAGPAHVVMDPTKGSRFIGDAAPDTTEAQAQAFIEDIRSRESSAHHHCYAWRLARGDRDWRAWDDGEPGGTAGLPILARIDGAELVGVVVVVTRYFGGTKLGKGGLIRAYGGAASRVLDAADIIERVQRRSFSLSYEYTDQGTIQGVLRAMNLTASSEDYGPKIRLCVPVPIEQIDEFKRAVQDRSAGRIQPVLVDASCPSSSSV